MPSIRIGIDIGGTFTDLQVLDETTGAAGSLKTPTTPADPSIGLMAGLNDAAARFGFALSDIRLLLHGTTIATNAVLERKLARGALLTTAGFTDVLEIGRHARRDIYGLRPRRDPPLIPAERRIGVSERLRADGSVERALTPAVLDAALDAVRRLAPETVAICLLHATANPAHERALRDHLRAALPGLPVSLSTDISPEIREFERTATTVLNALLVPVVRDYLDRLQRRLDENGLRARLLLVQSNGGVCSAAVAAAEPVRLLLSGPSGGAGAAERAAARLGIPDLVGVDMGGTSFDVCVVQSGRVAAAAAGEIDGLPVRLPMVEIRTIGAGGGSLARILPGDRLVVGPESAGARPGPACYGHGGTRPTVTDANLALGRLDPQTFLGGRFPLDPAAARRALDDVVGRPLSLATEPAAEGLLALTNQDLAAAIRLSLFEKGLDPRRFALLSFGGAGGLHAAEVADALGITRVVFPAGASTFSAGGILRSPIAHDLAWSRLLPLADATLPDLRAAADALQARGTALLDADGIPASDRELRFAADLRYRGQAFELVVPWPDRTGLDALRADFHALHAERFGYSNPGDSVELVTLRLAAIGRLPAIPEPPAPAPPPEASTASRRRPLFLAGAWHDTPVHRRAALSAPIDGPALIEEDDTTIFLPPGWRLTPGPDLLAEKHSPLQNPSAEGRVGVGQPAHIPPPKTLTPIDLEIIRNALTAAAAEMDVTIWRTSRSTVVRELLDYSTAIFTADGDNVAQSARIPQHLNSMGAGLQAILRDHLPLSEWRDGDVVCTNDPYCGGQHIPDILAFRPVFARPVFTRPDGSQSGREPPIAIVGVLCHHLDMGGSAAGSYGATATEIFAEGLRIPPLKLVKAGTLDPDLLAILRQNVRRPDMLWGDLQAQLAALSVGEANLQALAARIGPATLVDAAARLLDGSEAAMRDVIARMPDGRYEWEDFIDDDGLSPDPIRIHAVVEVAGDSLAIDLAGCGPQARGPVNATLASSGSAVAYAVIACADAPVPANAGCYRPVRLVAREGSIVHARHPAPVANRITTTHRLATTLLGALSQAIPDRIPAAYYGVSYVCTFQTVGARAATDAGARAATDDHTRHVLVEIEVGGSGAHAAGDGLHAYASGMHNNANIPVEMIESELPLTILSYALRPGSGGAGRFHGGMGLVREWRVDCPEAVFTANADRFTHTPYGLSGGHPAAPGRLTLLRDGVPEPLPSKLGNLRLRRGDVIRLETSGGGGFGPPDIVPSRAR